MCISLHKTTLWPPTVVKIKSELLTVTFQTLHEPTLASFNSSLSLLHSTSSSLKSSYAPPPPRHLHPSQALHRHTSLVPSPAALNLTLNVLSHLFIDNNNDPTPQDFNVSRPSIRVENSFLAIDLMLSLRPLSVQG